MVKSTKPPLLSISNAAMQHSHGLVIGFAGLLVLGVMTAFLSLQVSAISASLLVPLIVAPVVEELFFRGVIHEALMTRGVRPLPAIVMVSVLFAVAHLWNSTLGHALATALPAFVIGLTYQRVRSYGFVFALMTAMLLHGVFNALWNFGLGFFISNLIPSIA